MKKHNFKKNYYECLAKLVLENALPETFDDLELTDKPDLKKTDQIGIEVTRTFFEGEAHADGIFESIKMKPYSEALFEKEQKLQQLGYKLMVYNGIVCGYYPKEAFWVSDRELKKSFEDKLSKLADYSTKHTFLFVFTPGFGLYDESDMDEFVNWAAMRQKDCNPKYESIIVFQWKDLYVCNLLQTSVRRIPLSDTVISECCQKAKEHADEHS